MGLGRTTGSDEAAHADLVGRRGDEVSSDTGRNDVRITGMPLLLSVISSENESATLCTSEILEGLLNTVLKRLSKARLLLDEFATACSGASDFSGSVLKGWTCTSRLLI